ncbi:MAG: flp pilus-assembly TadE/G-like family protein [Acidothermaceae bacterium]
MKTSDPGSRHAVERRARQRARSRTEHRDAGSASIWIVSLVMVMWVTVAGVVVTAAAMTARHRAATAADLSALAGAFALAQATQDEMLTGHGPVAAALTPAQLVAIACSAADSTASANDAQLRSCTVEGSTLAVEAAVALPRLARWAQHGGIGSGYISARARAGPT